MSTFLAIWLIPGLVDAILLIGTEAWDRRHNPQYRPLTLAHLFQGFAMSVFPAINVLVCVVLLSYFFGEIAPKIVLFGPKK